MPDPTSSVSLQLIASIEDRVMTAAALADLSTAVEALVVKYAARGRVPSILSLLSWTGAQRGGTGHGLAFRFHPGRREGGVLFPNACEGVACRDSRVGSPDPAHDHPSPSRKFAPGKIQPSAGKFLTP